jgi:O-acetylhomoserine (thiol)-lyase
MDKKKFDTNCVHGTYKASNGEPQVLPIYQNTTYRYDNTDEVAAIFDLESDGHIYSRISNPTCTYLEEKMALLENGTAAVSASSGQSAILLAVLNITEAGDEIIVSSNIYGGTYNLFAVTLKKLGIKAIFVNPEAPEEDIISVANEKTKLIYSESLPNPSLRVLDIEKFARISKKLDIPLFVDNTLASPALCNPLDFGAEVVIHSTTKYSDGHASCLGGMVIEAGRFNWANGKFPGMVEADKSYHGVRFFKEFKEKAFTTRIRAVVLRDFGCTMAPMNAYLTHQGLQTLPLRMKQHSENALKLAEFLEQNPLVEWVKYPGLKSDEDYELAKKYLPKGQSGVLSFSVKGGLEAGKKVLNNLELTSIAVHVGDIRTLALQPSTTTHRQLSQEEQLEAGITPGLIRVSVGLESIDDIIKDFSNALEVVK